MRRIRTSVVGVCAIASLALLATACAPPAAPSTRNYAFRGTQVTVNESQDCLLPRIFGVCTSLDETDETYTLSIGFRVKIGVANSAQAWVAGSRDNYTSVSEGDTAALTGARQNAVTFNGVAPLDIVDVLTDNGDLEVIGVYTWASENDSVGNGLAAQSTADILEDALNQTLAAGSLPSDLSVLLDLILDNIGQALGILVQNIPLLGLGDDVLGGGLYIGVAAKGDLANIIDAAISDVSFSFAIPIATIPPDIQQGGIFTLGSNSTFTGQLFDGDCPGLALPQCGKHTYDFEVVRL